MDENRSYLSVTIPVHPYFAEEKHISEKTEAYRSRIIEALKEKPLSKNELAKVLGYKGISAKLTAEVDRMLAEKLIVKVMDGNRVKIWIKNCDTN